MKRTCICGVVNDATARVADGKDVEPEVGDYSMCFTCLRVSTFTETGYDYIEDIDTIPARQRAQISLALRIAKAQRKEMMH